MDVGVGFGTVVVVSGAVTVVVTVVVVAAAVMAAKTAAGVTVVVGDPSPWMPSPLFGISRRTRRSARRPSLVVRFRLDEHLAKTCHVAGLQAAVCVMVAWTWANFVKTAVNVTVSVIVVFVEVGVTTTVFVELAAKDVTVVCAEVAVSVGVEVAVSNSVLAVEWIAF